MEGGRGLRGRPEGPCPDSDPEFVADPERECECEWLLGVKGSPGSSRRIAERRNLVALKASRSMDFLRM